MINDKTLVDNCLKSAYAEIKELYFKLYDIMKDTLNSYSPKNIHNDLEGATFNVLYQQTIGVICYDLINSNILETPSESYSASIIYKNNNL